MKRYVKLLFSISILVLLTATVFIYAALTDRDTKGPIKYQVGKFEYVVSGDIMSNYIYPGINLVTENYSITNNSTVDTEIRIKVRFYLKDTWYEIENFYDYVEETGFDFNNSYWTENNGYLYYNETLVGGEVINLFTKIILDGHVIKNDYEGKPMQIELIIHAKQKDNVSWESLGSKLIN